MSSIMKEKDLALLKAQVTELAKGIKSESDLNDLTQQWVKMTAEAALPSSGMGNTRKSVVHGTPTGSI